MRRYDGPVTRKLTLDHRAALLATLMVALAGMVVLALRTGIGNYALDDGYIVDHAVAGLQAGRETRFPGATPWDGVTSPVHVLAVWMASSLFPIALAHWLVTSAAVLILAGGLYRICAQAGMGPLPACLVVLAAFAAGLTVFQLNNGLETGLAMAAIAWTLVALQADRPPAWAYGLFAILPFIRPELAALSGLCVLQVMWRQPEGWARGLAMTLLLFTVCAAALFRLTGAILPNTISAKTYFFAEGCLPLADKLSLAAEQIRPFGLGLGLAALGFVLVPLSRVRWVALAFMFIFLAAYVIRLPGALGHNYYRYLYMLLPFAVLGWASGLSGGSPRVRRAGQAAAMLALAQIAILSAGNAQFYLSAVRVLSRDNGDMAEWVAANIPPDAVILVHDAGRISLSGKQPLVDLVGLKTVSSIEVQRRTTFASCRRDPGAVSQIAENTHASYLVTTGDWEHFFGLTDALRSAGWSVERADAARGASHYRVYHLVPPAAL